MSTNAATFWDRIADKYAKSPISNEEIYRQKLQMTQALLGPDMRILEIGCGTGGTAREHAPHVAHVLATDISPRMIEIARERTEGSELENVDYRVAGFDEIEAPEDGFDAVLALSLLHLVPDPAQALRHIHELLKPGGVFVSSTACLSDGLWFLRYVAPLGRLLGKFPEVLHFFKGAEFEKMVEDAGFRVERRLEPGGWAGALFLIAVKD